MEIHKVTESAIEQKLIASTVLFRGRSTKMTILRQNGGLSCLKYLIFPTRLKWSQEATVIYWQGPSNGFN